MRKRKKHGTAIFKEMISALVDGSKAQGRMCVRKEAGEGNSAVEGLGCWILFGWSANTEVEVIWATTMP
jgi:hypothetical protein